VTSSQRCHRIWGPQNFKATCGASEPETGRRYKRVCPSRSIRRFCARPKSTRRPASWTLGAARACCVRWRANLGAQVSGLDATEPLLQIARERVPRGDFRTGEMENLPYRDQSFHVVIGINSFQFAASSANALREARRVLRRIAPVVIAVFGKPEDADPVTYMKALSFLSPSPSTAHWRPWPGKPA
jgi:SAM-dependent methyltransferase